MASLGVLEAVAVLDLVKTCIKRAATVLSNKKACYELADDLEVIDGILSGLKQDQWADADKDNLQRVLKKLHNIATRTMVLFRICQSGKMTVKIRSVVSSTNIKDELEKLDSRISKVTSMLLLVFKVKENNQLTRGRKLPPIDQSMFDEIDDENIETAEDYYLDVDD